MLDLLLLGTGSSARGTMNILYSPLEGSWLKRGFGCSQQQSQDGTMRKYQEALSDSFQRGKVINQRYARPCRADIALTMDAKRASLNPNVGEGFISSKIATKDELDYHLVVEYVNFNSVSFKKS